MFRNQDPYQYWLVVCKVNSSPVDSFFCVLYLLPHEDMLITKQNRFNKVSKSNHCGGITFWGYCKRTSAGRGLPDPQPTNNTWGLKIVRMERKQECCNEGNRSPCIKNISNEMHFKIKMNSPD